MKKNGCAIAGCVVEIIAGAIWLCVALFVNNIATALNGSLDIKQLIVPLCILILGVSGFFPHTTNTSLKAIGVLNLMFVVLQYFIGGYVGLGYLQMALLIVASLLLFCGKVTPNQN